MRRQSLTTRFALVSIVSMAALAVALVWANQRLLEEHARTEAINTAQAYVQVGIIPVLDPAVFSGAASITPRQIEALDKLFRGNPQATVRLWTPGRSQFYDSGRILSGADGPGAGQIPDPDRFDPVIQQGQAMAALTREFSQNGESVRRVDVYVPVTSGQMSDKARTGSGKVIGLVEVVLPYAPTAAAVAQGTRTILEVVVGGLVLLWLLLFRTVRSASQRLRFQASENARLAYLDELTGLPNRRLLSDRMERAAAFTRRSGDAVGLLLLDVDRFKEVNDTLGHPKGDDLLKQVAKRLEQAVRESDTVARLGGDEFAVLLPEVGSVVDAEAFSRRLQSVFDEPFDLDGLVLHVDTSIGLAVLPDHASNETELLAHADVAMYTAKAAGIGLATYSAAGDVNSTSRLVMLGDLRNALDTDQLRLHYQPKIDLRTGEVTGLEALLRWYHPTRGMVPPGDFIPIAEQTGLMHQITKRVLGLVGSQLATWRREGTALPVAVNLSARNLLEPDLDTVIAGLLEMHELPPELLELEITESAIVDDPARAVDMLNRLTALGITVAVDDFGIGNTSMSQLRTMPLRTIKIDRSFVTDLVDEPTHGVLVKAIIDLAHEFGLTAVAEGVESEPVIDRLREMDCDTAQGFHWSRPVPAEELPEVLARLAEAARNVEGRAPVRS